MIEIEIGGVKMKDPELWTTMATIVCWLCGDLIPQRKD